MQRYGQQANYGEASAEYGKCKTDGEAVLEGVWRLAND